LLVGGNDVGGDLTPGGHLHTLLPGPLTDLPQTLAAGRHHGGVRTLSSLLRLRLLQCRRLHPGLHHLPEGRRVLLRQVDDIVVALEAEVDDIDLGLIKSRLVKIIKVLSDRLSRHSQPCSLPTHIAVMMSPRYELITVYCPIITLVNRLSHKTGTSPPTVHRTNLCNMQANTRHP